MSQGSLLGGSGSNAPIGVAPVIDHTAIVNGQMTAFDASGNVIPTSSLTPAQQGALAAQQEAANTPRSAPVPSAPAPMTTSTALAPVVAGSSPTPVSATAIAPTVVNTTTPAPITPATSIGATVSQNAALFIALGALLVGGVVVYTLTQSPKNLGKRKKRS